MISESSHVANVLIKSIKICRSRRAMLTLGSSFFDFSPLRRVPFGSVDVEESGMPFFIGCRDTYAEKKAFEDSQMNKSCTPAVIER